MIAINPAHLAGFKAVALPGVLNGLCPFLLALFTTSHLGVLVCDRRLRYQAINHALARMNGVPPAAHLGKTFHRIIGNATEIVQPAFDHVFATGAPLYNFQVTVQLPTRNDVGDWVTSLIPIADRVGRVRQVAAIVQEVTSTARLATSVRQLADGLRAALSTVKRQKRSSRGALEGLLQRSVAHAQAISDLVAPCSTRATKSSSGYCQTGSGLIQDEYAHVLPPVRAMSTEASLSARELQVLAFLAGGQSNKQIAAALALSVRTVETYRARLMLKLGLHSIPELVHYAIRNNLV